MPANTAPSASTRASSRCCAARNGSRSSATCRTQEQVHLDTFSKLIAKRRVRPTALLPIWHVAGFALGAATALLGHRAAMACTVAVEEAIDEHYQAQEAALGDDEARAARQGREVPRRGAGAPRHRPGARGRADPGLPAAERGDQGRLQGGDQGERADLMQNLPLARSRCRHHRHHQGLAGPLRRLRAGGGLRQRLSLLARRHRHLRHLPGAGAQPPGLDRHASGTMSGRAPRTSPSTWRTPRCWPRPTAPWRSPSPPG